MSRRNIKEILLLELDEAELLIRKKGQQRYGPSEKMDNWESEVFPVAINSKK